MTYPLPQKSFCLIRHGETTANRDDIIAGRLEVSLTDKGRDQAKSLQRCAWPLPCALFASPMHRARETCSLGFPGRAYQIHAGLRERDWGVFEGKPLHLLPPRDGQPPEGEDWAAMIARVGAAIAECCERAGDHLPVMICHSGTIRAARLLAGQPSVGRRPTNAAPVHFVWRDRQHQETLHSEMTYDR